MTLQIDLPDDAKAQLQRRAAESGYENIEEYARALLMAEIDDPYVPAHLEAELLRRLDDPTPPLTMEQFQADLARKLGRPLP
jgi:plasmid stability protein